MPDSITSNSPTNFLANSFDAITQFGEETLTTSKNIYDVGKETLADGKDEVVDYGMGVLSNVDFLSDRQNAKLEEMVPGFDEIEQFKTPIPTAGFDCSVKTTWGGAAKEETPNLLDLSVSASVSCKVPNTPVGFGFEAGTNVSVDKEILKNPTIGNLIQTGKEIGVSAGPTQSVSVSKGLVGASADFKQKASVTIDQSGIKSVGLSESHTTGVSGGVGFDQEVGDLDLDYFELTGTLAMKSAISYGREGFEAKANAELSVDGASEKVFVAAGVEANETNIDAKADAGHYEWKESTNINLGGYGYSNESVKRVSDYTTNLNF